ncbi:MAG: hypothetical protein IJE43_11755 [Alphaproteobacteria bacterium]|nr:hypothetical protein [Alphaproteobacteria bacterium]
MNIESKKVIYLEKLYDKIRKYCMMNFIYKNSDGSAIIYDSVLKYVNKLVEEVKKQDIDIKKKRKDYINRIEELSAQGFSYRYIKKTTEQKKRDECIQKAKKEYMDKIIYEAYYKKKEDDRDFGGDLDIWGMPTKEYNFIKKLGIVNPYAEFQKMTQREEGVILEIDDIIKLLENTVNIFENPKDKHKLKDEILDVFLSFGIILS